jgi:agmatine deiminase
MLKLGLLGASATLGCTAGKNVIGDQAAVGQANRSSRSNLPNYQATGAELLARTTPLEDGFFFPAEWEPHEYTIMAFPPAQNWQGYGLEEARQEWADVANAVSEFEPVLMVVQSADRRIAQNLLNSEIELIEFPLNDAWSRDTGPMVLVNAAGERRIAGFTFNGWGQKFPPYEDDALLKARLAATLEMPLYVTPLVLEGGAVALDGEGTIITTAECLLHPNRNPGLSRGEVEQVLKQYLGGEKVIWLERGLTPDPITDGHVDGICAIAAPGVVLLHQTDSNYKFK